MLRSCFIEIMPFAAKFRFNSNIKPPRVQEAHQSQKPPPHHTLTSLPCLSHSPGGGGASRQGLGLSFPLALLSIRCARYARSRRHRRRFFFPRLLRPVVAGTFCLRLCLRVFSLSGRRGGGFATRPGVRAAAVAVDDDDVSRRRVFFGLRVGLPVLDAKRAAGAASAAKTFVSHLGSYRQ